MIGARWRWPCGGNDQTALPGLEARRRRFHSFGPLALGSIQNFGGNAFYAGCGFVITMVLARAYGAEDAGTFFVATSLFVLLAGVLRLGADVGLFRMIAWHRGASRPEVVPYLLRTALVPVTAVSILASALIVLVAGPLAGTLMPGQPMATARTFLLIGALALPFLVLHQCIAEATRGFGTMGPFNVLGKVLRPGIQLLGVVAVTLLAPSHSWLLMVAWSAPALLTLVIGGLWIRRLTVRAQSLDVQDPSIDSGRSPVRVDRRAFWKFSLPRAGAALFDVGTSRLDIILLGALAGVADAALYTVAGRLLLLANFLHAAIANAIAPSYTWLMARENDVQVQRQYRRSTVVSAALSWPVLVLLAINGAPFLRMFGAEFVAAEPVLAILAVAMLLRSGTGTVSSLLLMSGYSVLNLFNSGVAFALNIGLNLLLIPRYGMIGAAAAWSISIAAQNLLPLAQVWLRMRFHPVSRQYCAVGAAAIILFGGAAVVSRVLAPGSLVGLLAAATVAVGPYAFLLRWVMQRPPRTPMQHNSNDMP